MMSQSSKLKRLNLNGFKSIDSAGQSIDFGDITVLLGANGSGKSNLISFFKMMGNLTSDALQLFIGEQGSADSVLHLGVKKTPRLRAELTFQDNNQGKETYDFTLSHASRDSLIFIEEWVTWQKDTASDLKKINFGAGHRERNIGKEKDCDPISLSVLQSLKGCRCYQFHDTSSTAKIRNQGYIEDSSYLRDDGGNLAAFLFAMKQKPKGEKYYQRIVSHIGLVFPQFADFSLQPSALNESYIMLNWKEKHSDYLFGPHQISDGTLRFMALVTLLLQPKETIPSIIVLDEPELGLHPSAIASLADIIHLSSENSQIVLATQSPRLVDEFEPAQLVIVERDAKSNRSTFKQLNEDALEDWLERYCLSDIWEKNVFGGRP